MLAFLFGGPYLLSEGLPGINKRHNKVIKLINGINERIENMPDTFKS
jgi:hypothetical protein